MGPGGRQPPASVPGPTRSLSTFATEQPLLEDPFETGRLSTPRVDRYSQICVRMNRHSVPVRLIGRTVRVLLHASELVVYDGRAKKSPGGGGAASRWPCWWRTRGRRTGWSCRPGRSRGCGVRVRRAPSAGPAGTGPGPESVTSRPHRTPGPSPAGRDRGRRHRGSCR
ncbi:hypothetical protein [Streptomyces sp. NPDC127092]|uniref:Mu transposase domain-containing protein n=1 Tax=Streptomyces sp. NPDC127092 TaxID=3347135 RepID=UPI003659DB5D